MMEFYFLASNEMIEMNKRIVVVGSGNVATHLALALYKKGYDILQVYSRQLANAETLANRVGGVAVDNIADIVDDADFYFISVKDDAIADIVSSLKIQNPDAVVAHTAGSVPLSVLSLKVAHSAVFYPMQTFTKSRELDFSVIPCFIEASDAETFSKIKVVAGSISNRVVEADSARVIVGIRAHYIDVLEPNGDLLVRHMRQYGATRTDINDYSTSLEMLSKNIGAWSNSGFRKDAPQLIRDYIDSKPRSEQKSCIRLLNDLTKQYGYQAAVDAFEQAIRNNSVNRSDAAILAARIIGYGIDTPPEPGPSLEVYDQTFLNGMNKGEEAVRS